MGCACSATGGAKKPLFDAGKNFVCDSGNGITFSGKVAGKDDHVKITQGFAEDVLGDTFVFRCRRSARPCGTYGDPASAFLETPAASLVE
jgi:hypothetical protein